MTLFGAPTVDTAEAPQAFAVLRAFFSSCFVRFGFHSVRKPAAKASPAPIVSLMVSFEKPECVTTPSGAYAVHPIAPWVTTIVVPDSTTSPKLYRWRKISASRSFRKITFAASTMCGNSRLLYP